MKSARNSKLDRGMGAIAQSTRKRASQGSPLPRDGSVLDAYPVGSCVMIDGSWFIIAMRLMEAPYLSRLCNPPTSLEWNVRDHSVKMYPLDTVVSASCWPMRASATRDETEHDPMMSNLRLDGGIDARGSVHRSVPS